MLKPVHITTINTDAERLARSSQGTSRDIEAVARAWDKDALVLPNMFKRGSITIATLKPLPPEAKKHIALAAPVTTHIMYEVDGVEEDHGPDDSHDRSDPWVKVGTTTIDGTYAQVNAMFGVDAVGKTTSLGPTLVGGRMLRPTGWHLNKDLQGCALVFCDIVRRQSEIEAEKKAREQAILGGLMRVHMSNHECPECGPHGNRGEVLLASSWAKCTTCAGGKPGDLWGEVKAEQPLVICGVDVNSKPTCDGVRAALTTTIKGLQTYSEGERVVDRWGRTGVVVPADERAPKSVRVRMDAGWTGIFSLREIAGKVDVRSEVKREALRDLRSILLDRPDDMSVEDFRRMVLGGGTVP